MLFLSPNFSILLTYAPAAQRWTWNGRDGTGQRITEITVQPPSHPCAVLIQRLGESPEPG
jgi:hypothetical protein